MSEDTKIKVPLELEDHLSEGLKKAGEGFEHLNEHAKELTHEFTNMAKQSIAMAAGFQLNASIDGVKELAGEFMNAAKEAGGQTKAIASILAMNDQAGTSWDDLKEHAKGYREELEDVSNKTGISVQSAVDAFSDISARGGKSAGVMVDMVEKMAMASRAVPGGLAGMSEGFAMFEAGMYRARNPIVQLITQAHLLKGNAKEVAHELQKMKPEDAMKLGETAIERMADRMKSVKPTFGELVQTAKNTREKLMVEIGTPLLTATRKPLEDILKYFQKHSHEMEEYAKIAGEKVGQWVTAAADKFREGFEYLKDHSQEISDAVKEGWAYAKSVVDLIVSHKDLIKMGLEVYAGAQVAGGLGSVVGGVSGALGGPSAAGGLLKGAMAAGAPSLGIAGTAAGGSAVAAAAVSVAALAAAAAAVAAAAGQWLALNREMQDKAGENDEAKQKMKELADAGDYEQLERVTNALKLQREEATANSSAMGMWLDEFLGIGNTLGMSTAEMEKYNNELLEQARFSDEVKSEVVGMLSDVNASVGEQGEDLSGTAARIVDAYNYAADQGGGAAQKYAAQFLLNSGLTAQALIDSGLELQGGFEEFQAMFADAAGDTKDMLKNFMTGGGKPGGGKFEAPQVHIGAGGTFNIHQDFRDKDPDRIVAVMRKDLVHAAQARSQSRFGSAFGGL